MKYLYPIRRGAGDYHYGSTDKDETVVENLCNDDCSHEGPIESSDCFRNRLLKNKPTIISIEPVKCCVPKCANTSTSMVNYGYNFQFAVCKNHQDKASIKKVCGFGFPLLLKDL